MRLVCPTEGTEFLPLQPFRGLFLVFHGRVISIFTLRAFQNDLFPHFLDTLILAEF